MFAARSPPSPGNTEIEARSHDNGPPDGGYGWWCVVSCFLINSFTWGITASYGVYLAYYLESDVFPGASTIDFALIGGLNFSAAMVVSPLATVLTRVYGKHFTMALGIVFQALGYGAASFSEHIWQLYISQGVLVGLGTGFLYIPSTAILSQWFSKKRSLANGISAGGSGVGGALFAWATRSMIDKLSLAWALRVTALLGFAANAIATMLIRDRNKHIRPPQLALDMRLLLRVDVCLLLCWAFVSMLGYIALLFSLADFARSIGLSQAQSTDVIGFLNIGTAIGRPVIGVWSDRFRRIEVAAILTVLCGLSCFAFWLPAMGYGFTVFFSVWIGAILGIFWMTIGPLCVEVVGLQDLPSLLSISWLTIALPTTVSEVIALELRRNSDSHMYLYTQIFAGSTYLAAGTVMGILAILKGKQESAVT